MQILHGPMTNNGFMLWHLTVFKWKGQIINYERYSHRDLRDIHETFFLTILSTVYFQAFFKAHKCTSEFWLINFKPQSLPGRRNSYKRFREKKNQWKRNLLYHMRSIPWVFWTIMTWYNGDAVAFALFSHCFLCLWLSGPIFARYDRCLKPRKLTSVWSKFMWNFPRPLGESVFMNCNKKSHFDNSTSVRWMQRGWRNWFLFASE